MKTDLKFDFLFANGKSKTITALSFKEAVRLIFNESLTPLKMLMSNGKVLYFDDNLFRNFLREDISQSELIELTECDGLFRNTEPFMANMVFEIDADSLWKKQGAYFILVDGNQYVEVSAVPQIFKEI